VLSEKMPVFKKLKKKKLHYNLFFFSIRKCNLPRPSKLQEKRSALKNSTYSEISSLFSVFVGF